MEPLSDPERNLLLLSADISEQEDQTSALAAARSRFVAVPAPPQRSMRRVVVVAAAACAALALVLWLPVERAAVSFSVGDPPVALGVGDWVSADESTIDLVFSDGTQVVLTPGSRARVTSASATAVEVLLEQGQIAANVVPSEGRRKWRFRAGPYRIDVTGTAFDAAWDPATEVARVQMRRGSVEVHGPLLVPSRTLTAGERLLVSLRDQRMEVTSGSSDPSHVDREARASAVGSPRAEAAAAAPSESSRPTTAIAVPVNAPPAAGTENAKASPSHLGERPDPTPDTSDVDFASALSRVSVTALLALADSARLGGRADRARQALLVARQRGARGQTAFLLGKIAADQLGSPSEAVGWFETYLAEQPNGALAEQALGRMLELQRRSPEAAQATAQRYLAKFPGGAFAALARSLAQP